MSRQLLVARVYHFESAHFLPHVPDWHRCKRMHGHNYEVEVTLTGKLDHQGFIVDFWDIDRLMDPLLKLVDHQVLNEISGLENPTAENITGWFFDRLQQAINGEPWMMEPPQVMAVRVWETKTCYAVMTAHVPAEQFRQMIEDESPT